MNRVINITPSKYSSHPYVSCSEDDDVDERPVQDVTYTTFYSPHRFIALFVAFIWILLLLFISRGSTELNYNMSIGFISVCGVFIIISSLLYPNGPFIRPHPINYAEDCRFTWETIKPQIDIFCFCHFWGWLCKSIVIRHSGISWYQSIMWELSELFFQHLLPNFQECWWDMLILDIILCNGLGIVAGSYFLHWLEFRTYHWESVKMIKGARGKLKRVILQFSPMSFDPTNWFSTDSLSLRIVQLSTFSVIWQTSELNTFFLKHVFVINTCHWLVSARLVLILFLALSALRATCGMQTWIRSIQEYYDIHGDWMVYYT
ncbi:hypothetical protein HZS_3125, partial [Henneguya salminicola]